MKAALQQQQKTNLSITPELRQAIELLQYSTFELEQYIRAQEAENPLIELEEKNESDSHIGNFVHISGTRHNPGNLVETIADHDENSRDDLYKNAKLVFEDKHIQQLLKFLIYNLDDNGYLRLLGKELLFSEADIEEGIHLLQQVGPIGIGARTLKECLLLQIQYVYPDEISAKCLIEKHLNLLADRKWKEISSRMKIPLEELKHIYAFIQTLNPRPCSFTHGSIEYLIPDIIVETHRGHLTFRLNDGYVPSIRLNSCYAPVHRPTDDTSQYINSQFQKAQWLLSSIEQRRNTIRKIVSVLLDKQEKFFKYGFHHLKPLTLKEIADEIGMHESTVSRATSNKVIQTVFGSFNVGQLFTSKLTDGEGDSISTAKVKSMIQKFISQEDKCKPYSDQKVMEYLASSERIVISRRTVNKYREELKIPSASKRKEI